MAHDSFPNPFHTRATLSSDVIPTFLYFVCAFLVRQCLVVVVVVVSLIHVSVCFLTNFRGSLGCPNKYSNSTGTFSAVEITQRRDLGTLGSVQFNLTYLPEEKQLIIHLIRAKVRRGEVAERIVTK